MSRKVTIITMLLFIIAGGLFAFQMTGAAEESGVPDDILYTKSVKAVLFSHKTHTGMGMDCTACHTKLFQMAAKDAESKSDFTMKGLYEGKYCGSCHAPKGMAFASNTQCARCHVGVKGLERREKNKTPGTATAAVKSQSTVTAAPSKAALGPKKPLVYKMKDADPVAFSHTKHMAKAKCTDCHTAIWQMKKGGVKMTMDKMYEGKYCGTCHNEKKAFSAMECAKCHKEQKKN